MDDRQQPQKKSPLVLVAGIIVAVAVAFLLYDVLKDPDNGDNGSGAAVSIQIEAESFDSVVPAQDGPIVTRPHKPPLQGEYLAIPPGVGKPGYDPKTKETYPPDWGVATYSFDAPTEGEYVFKAYCYWEDQCSNSFRLRLNDDKTTHTLSGNVFKQWRWETLPPRIKLKKGPNKLTFINNEDGIKVDFFRIESPPE